MTIIRKYTAVALALWPMTATAAEMQLLWGDTHVHSSYSFDAFLNGNHSADPEVAYRFARGEPVIHPSSRVRAQIDRPLDFIVVADHAEFMGVAREVYYNGWQLADDAGALDRVKGWFAEKFIRYLIDQGGASSAFDRMMPKAEEASAAARWQLTQKAPIRSAYMENKTWRSATELADTYYEPGKFTTFVGWEWSSTPGGANLHRIVVSNADSEQARQFEPFSAVDSPYPEDLWNWLAETHEKTGVDFLSIPHNSNVSKGYMFDDKTLRGDPITGDYARLRSQWETVAEVTQTKGDSETHSALSPNDEFADFEIYGWYMQAEIEPYKPQVGDYLRSTLKRGLELGERVGVNPYRLGLIGSTDVHTALSSVEEDNFYGKHANQAIPETKTRVEGASGWSMSAAGRAAVWAEHNDRDAILAALKRREVYATTGPRIGLQFFGGWDFGDLVSAGAEVMQQARQQGVPMGGELSGESAAMAAPEFLVMALKDPMGANLDRVQVVKGWLKPDGEAEEHVYNVAWSGDRALDSAGDLPAVGNTVDMKTGRYTNSIGAVQLSARWRDPDFDASQAAFYYVRVLEIPTPRHLLLDALALGLKALPEGDAIIQERAYSSPIWYRP